MPKKSNTLTRQWALLKAIPGAPQHLSTPQLHQRMHDEGFGVDIRSIQRDLNELSTTFPLDTITEGRTHYWFWMEGAKGLEIPRMSRETALVFQMANQYLLPLMPGNVLKLLAPYFERAGQTLRDSRMADWKSKIMHIETGPQLTPPELSPVVRNVVYEALLQGLRFEATYVRRYESRPVSYTINPLGIVTREGVVYLVCTLWEYTDVIQLAVHRFRAAKLSDQEARPIDGFDLRAYVRDQAAFGYPQSDKSIRLKALFDEGAAFHLTERTLSADQQLKKLPDGRCRLTATVHDTGELRWWLLGFGDGVEVLAPKALRSEFKDMTANMARMYT